MVPEQMNMCVEKHIMLTPYIKTCKKNPTTHNYLGTIMHLKTKKKKSSKPSRKKKIIFMNRIVKDFFQLGFKIINQEEKIRLLITFNFPQIKNFCS